MAKLDLNKTELADLLETLNHCDVSWCSSDLVAKLERAYDEAVAEAIPDLFRE